MYPITFAGVSQLFSIKLFICIVKLYMRWSDATEMSKKKLSAMLEVYLGNQTVSKLIA